MRITAKKFDVSGMTCSACSAAVDRAVRSVDGVEDVSVSLLTNSMTVTCDDSVSDDIIILSVKKAGYDAGIYVLGKKSSDIAQKEYEKLKSRLIKSIIFTVPLFYVSMGHMIGIPLPQILHHGNRGAVLFALIQLILCIPVIIINFDFFRDGTKALLNRSPNMNTLISIGSGASVLYGLWITGSMIFDYFDIINKGAFTDRTMDLYFESAAMILTLITVGKTLESRAKRRTSDAISKLIDLTPKTASVEKDGVETEILVQDIRVGDIVIIRSGQTVPVDGVIISGSCSVDESAITGESIPADRSEGDTLVSSGILKSGFVKMKAEKVGSDTTIAQIIKLVEEASSSKAPISRLADKVSGIFVPIVISIAVITFIVWFISGADITFALRCAISVLVISCPCALGLATPTAIMSGVGRGASLGILIKSAEVLETSHKIDTIVLDKTGTVTEGKMRVTDIICSDETGESEFLASAASLECASSHPIATAITKEAALKSIRFNEPDVFREVAGGGIIGSLENNRQLAGGNLKLMQSLGINCPDKIISDIERLSSEGKTPLIFAEFERTLTEAEKSAKDVISIQDVPFENIADGKIMGIIAVADTVKKSSPEAVGMLKSYGADVIMLTGDNKSTASAIAKQAGIDESDVISGVLPDGKEAEISRLMQSGRTVAMVGDGINDAPALVRADVGIAVGAGTDIAIESADIVLVRGDLRDVASAISLSHAVMRNIKQNLMWAFVYNVAGIPLAAGVLYPLFKIGLDPMYAAAAMSLSSFCVVMNALRLKRFKPDKAIKIKSKSQKQKNIILEDSEMFVKKKNTVTLEVSGMSCAHCSARVEKALNETDSDSGSLTVKVDLKKGTATVSSDHEIDAVKLCEAVKAAGYEAKVK